MKNIQHSFSYAKGVIRVEKKGNNNSNNQKNQGNNEKERIEINDKKENDETTEKNQIEELISKFNDKYKDRLIDEKEEPSESETLFSRVKTDYGVDLSGLTNPLDRLKKYSKRFESILTESVLDTDNPKEALNYGENTLYSILQYCNSEKAETYMKKRINIKVNHLLKHKLSTVITEKSELEELITDTDENVSRLRNEKNNILRKAGKGNRDRARAYKEYEACEDKLLDLLGDLEEAELNHNTEQDLSRYIKVIEDEIDRTEKDREIYGDLITQAQGLQEISNEKYDMIINKICEQKYIKNEIRKYLQTINKLQRKLELYMDNDYTEFYNKPIERVNVVRQIISDSVRTINKLVEASYVSNEILKGFPEFEIPETKDITDFGEKFEYDDKVQRDQANIKGIELAKVLKEKRKAEIESTYDFI